MAGGGSRAAGNASSVTAAPCQLPQRGSRGRFAPFLPPVFMRGEGHEVAGGVPRSGRNCLLSHGCAVPAPPKGKPRELRSDNRSFQASPLKRRGNLPDEWYSGTASLAPRIYEGGGPRSGGGSPPRGGESLLSHGFAVPAPPEGKPRVLRTVPRSRSTGSLHTGWFSRNGSLFCSGFLLFTLGHGQFVAAVVFFVGGVTLDPVGADLMELT